MKTISLEVSEEVAEKLMAMDKDKRQLALKFITDIDKKTSWKELFIKTSDQAKKQGLTEKKLKDLLNEK